MARRLNTYVTVHERDDDGNLTGQSHTFGPDDKLPDWAAKAITNPDVWEGADDTSTTSAAPASTSQSTPDGAPPLSGRGSGRDAWETYARQQGVEVTDEMSREDIVAAVQSRTA